MLVSRERKRRERKRVKRRRGQREPREEDKGGKRTKREPRGCIAKMAVLYKNEKHGEGSS